MRYVYVTGYLSLAAIIQLLMGNFPLSFVAFPLNIVFGLFGCSYCGNYIRKVENRLLHASFPPQTSILSIFLLIAGSLIIGLFPQLSDVEAAMHRCLGLVGLL